MKKLALTTALASLGLLAACGPYPPGDCRYDNNCKGHVYKEGGTMGRTVAAERVVPTDRIIIVDGARYYLADDSYYYANPDYRGYRYVYRDGYMNRYYDPNQPPVGGWNKPDGPDRHPDNHR